MLQKNNPRQAVLKRDTRVLYHIRDTQDYLMSNDMGEEQELLRVFCADRNGRIGMEGYLLGSVFAHDPYIIPRLEKAECMFGELNPGYFDADPVVNGLIGQAVGDAFGVPVEFLSREKVRELDLRDMLGNDCPLSFTSRWSGRIPRGAWSDDTSMTVAAMASVVRNRGRIDYDDIMRQFLGWWDRGDYASLDFPFGLGGNIGAALDRFRAGVPALECGGKGFMDNGNGALMRMFPFSMYCILKGLDDDETQDLIGKAACITHGHEINAMSCLMYTQFLFECRRTGNPELAYRNAVMGREGDYARRFSQETVKAHELIFSGMDRNDFDEDRIPQSGYVIDSLAVAVCSILRTGCYEDAVRMAVNFGYDTDTNAAVTGSIAGVLYGMERIPERWLRDLRKKDELIRWGKRFSACLARGQTK